MLVGAFQQAGEPKTLLDEFKAMIRDFKAQGDWKFPNSHHVTTLFIGGSKQKLKSPIYENF